MAYYVYDMETGMVIASHDEDTPRPIASVTKLVSSAVFYTDTELDDEVTITASDVATEGESGRLKAGDKYLARELVFPALLESSNDASSAQARVYPGDMLLAMHALANRADATDATFSDTSGLNGNRASARSLGKLLTLIAAEQPHLLDITKLNKFVHENTTWLNNNPLSELPGYLGGKHGYTHEAGRTAVAIYSDTIATGQERRVGYVVLGSSGLVDDVQALRAYTSANVRFE